MGRKRGALHARHPHAAAGPSTSAGPAAATPAAKEAAAPDVGGAEAAVVKGDLASEAAASTDSSELPTLGSGDVGQAFPGLEETRGVGAGGDLM